MVRPNKEKQASDLFEQQIEYALLSMSISQIMQTYMISYEQVRKIKESMQTTRSSRRCAKRRTRKDHAA